MNVGDAINQLLQERQESVSALAGKIGVPQPTIYRIVMGESKNPKLENIEKIAKYFGVHPYALARGEIVAAEGRGTTYPTPSSPINDPQVFISPEVQQLITYFNGLTASQREAILATVKAQADHNQALLLELSGAPPVTQPQGKVRRSA